ncbi:MAG: methyltransferase domain-containing protein [Armatimonadetes bacterium]|nr:methyltransferase domain-containing protein [Armatimonadota bacterium]
MSREVPLGKLVKRALRKGFRQLGLDGAGSGKPQSAEPPLPPEVPPVRALRWLASQEHPAGGVRVHSTRQDAYPEVTGYLIPTLLRYGEKALAGRFLRWILCIQRADGSHTSPEGDPYIFDTGQALRGLLAGSDLMPQAREAARRAADYLCAQMEDGGRGGFGKRYPAEVENKVYKVPESVHLYALPPLAQAAEAFGEPRYREAAERCIEHYARQPDALQPATLTHFLAYELEALIDLGRSDLAAPVLETLRKTQAEDGSVPGMEGAGWVCSPGLAQLALCWYKTGQPGPADRALAWLEAHQQRSGGFLGSYGPEAGYHPAVELPWSAKFYLDAHLWRMENFWERNRHTLPSAEDEARAQAVLAGLEPGSRVLEVGCFAPSLLQAIQRGGSDLECAGLSLLPMESLPAGGPDIRQGAPERMAFPDNSFDVVYAVLPARFAANLDAVIGEITRAARVGGRVLVFHKDGPCGLPWECPSGEAAVRQPLQRGCDRIQVEESGEGEKVFSGIKRSALSGSSWNEVLIRPEVMKPIVKRLRQNQVYPWGQEVILATRPGDKLLEVGSGTGEMSLFLAQTGRKVTILDISEGNIEFTHRCAEEIGVSVQSVCGDATRPLPFEDGEFDCAWSSGLLDRLTDEERRGIIRECARVSSGQVIIMVANAASLAYRIGMAIAEETGTWPYGLEKPIHSLRDDFEAAGLKVVEEKSPGARHALQFLPQNHPLRKILTDWMEAHAEAHLLDCNQGYMLVTRGVKA